MTLPSCSRRTSVPGAPAGPSGSASGTGGVAVLPDAVAPLAALALPAPPALTARALTVGLLLGAFLGGLLLVVDDDVEGELAAGVDLGALDLHLLADGQDVLDVVHPLAADEPADLGDVAPAVLPRRQRDERTEGRRLDDGTDEALAELRHRPVGGRVDRLPRRLRRGAVDRADVHGAVVLDGDVGAGVLLDLVDHLALGADDLTDLVDGDLDGDDTRCGGGHLVGGVDDLGHDVEDV